MISVINYIKVYDELEVKANNWMMEMIKSNIVNVKSLEEENIKNISLQYKFNKDENEDFYQFSSLLYLHSGSFNGLTTADCIQIYGIYNSKIFNNFYEFYDSLNVGDIKQKVEQFILNPFLIKQIRSNQLEYLLSSVQKFEYGQVTPIKVHMELFKEVSFEK
uniref:Uncharacterized protein n=1 Tax=Meloidogyne hapla TaxID=6305 RepID=A0A1I8BLY0_MELHA